MLFEVAANNIFGQNNCVFIYFTDSRQGQITNKRYQIYQQKEGGALLQISISIWKRNRLLNYRTDFYQRCLSYTAST